MSADVMAATLPSMTTFPPPAEELRLLENELRQLDARRAQLLARRAWLLSMPAPPAPSRPVWGDPAAPAIWRAPDSTGDRPEATAPSVQNVLLILGGVLLTIAAMAFTLVSWGHLGITGRAAVLGAVTLGALGAPAVLLRRGLRSTAESVAGLGLALTVLDAYALHEVALPGTDGTGYAAAASAVLAGLWAVYGRLLGELRLPLPAALVSAQFPLLLWAFSIGAGPRLFAAALLATAAADTLVALRTSLRPVRIVVVVGAAGAGAPGVSAAGLLSWWADGPWDAARAAALLALAAAIALTAARQVTSVRLATAGALASGLLLVAALGGILRTVLPDGWAVLGYLLCGAALLAVVRASVPDAIRRGLLQASGIVQAVALFTALPAVAVTVLGPLGWVERIWSGAPADARAAVGVHTPWPPDSAVVPLVLGVLAAVLAGAPAAWRPRAVCGSLTLGWATVLVLEPSLALPYPAVLAADSVVTVAALALFVYSTNHPRLRLTALVLTLVTALSLAFLALPAKGPTLGVLAALTVLFAVGGFLTREDRRPSAAAACASFAYGTALVCSVGAALGWETPHVALLVPVVPLVAALLAPRLAEPVPVEVTGAAAAGLAVVLASPDLPVLSLVLALTGVIAAGTALRADRRGVGHAAAALFVLATWVRLAAWEVGTPEAYTLPVAVPALVVGLLRRRRDPRIPSWTAYGPGLATGLLPSLLTVLSDPEWLRPLLLGTAALGVTLAGARHRLRAPLVLGGGTLVLVALHELAPYLVQLAGVLPRWVPPALAGLALLALGATYEQRLRDARRVREALGRMR